MDALEEIIRQLEAGSITAGQAKRRMAALEGKQEGKHRAKLQQAGMVHIAGDAAGSMADEARGPSSDEGGQANRYPAGVIVGSWWGEPGTVAQANEAAEYLLERIDQLPENWRRLLRARYVDGLSGKDIAQRLGISEPAVSRALRKARKQLGEGVNFSRFIELIGDRTREVRTPGNVVIASGLTPAERSRKSFVGYNKRRTKPITKNRLDAYLAACFDVSVESARSMITTGFDTKITPNPRTYIDHNLADEVIRNSKRFGGVLELLTKPGRRARVVPVGPRSVAWDLLEWAKRTRRELLSEKVFKYLQLTGYYEPWWSRNEDGEIVIVSSHITDQEVFARLANPARVQAQRQDTREWPSEILRLDKEDPLAKALDEEAKALRRAGKQYNSHLGLPSPLLLRPGDRHKWGSVDSVTADFQRAWRRARDWDELMKQRATERFERSKANHDILRGGNVYIEDLSDRLVGRPPREKRSGL